LLLRRRLRVVTPRWPSLRGRAVVTPAEAVAYRDAQRDVVALARAALADWWRGLDVSDAKSAVSALESFVPDLVAAYGDVAATVAADWYDVLRGQAGCPGRTGRGWRSHCQTSRCARQPGGPRSLCLPVTLTVSVRCG